MLFLLFCRLKLHELRETILRLSVFFGISLLRFALGENKEGDYASCGLWVGSVLSSFKFSFTSLWLVFTLFGILLINLEREILSLGEGVLTSFKVIKSSLSNECSFGLIFLFFLTMMLLC